MPRPLIAVALAAACAESPNLSVASQGLYCDEFLCTGNGTTVIGFPFGELHEGGAISPTGFAIDSVTAPGGEDVELDVTGPWPRIIFDDGTSKSGSQMKWTTIRLRTPHLPPNDFLTLTITDYKQIPYFDGLPGPRIAAFEIEYQYFDPDVGTWLPADLCPFEEVDESGVAGSWTIMSKGDRFSKDASIIATGAGVGGWFNISCAGAVPAKLLRMRHAKAAEDATHKTTLDQRKAALRMFTAKYCETGTLYTQTGQPLTWEDYPGWSTPIKSTPEAVWTATGAYCLVEPRYADPDDIACDIPICSKAILENWRARGLLMSFIPAK